MVDEGGGGATVTSRVRSAFAACVEGTCFLVFLKLLCCLKPHHNCRYCARAAAAASSELDGMRLRLLQHACTADLVLDLHCCFDACRHLFTLPSQAQVPSYFQTQNPNPLTTNQMFNSLSSRLRCAAVLTADVSGGNAFDEACSLPWQTLSRQYPGAGFDAETCAACAPYIDTSGRVCNNAKLE